MDVDHSLDRATLLPGEWIATAAGRVIAHGLDLQEVAEDACRQAHDIAFERIPFVAEEPPQPPPPRSTPLIIPAFPVGGRLRRAAAAAPRRAAAPLPSPH